MGKSGGASRTSRTVAERKARPARASEAPSTSSQPVYSAYRVRQDSRGFFHVEGQPTAGGAWHDVGKAHATQAIAERALKTRATKDAKLSGQRAATQPANVQQVATYSRNRNTTRRTETTPATPAKAASPARARSGAAATTRNQDNAQARAIERQIRASQARTAPTRALEQQIRDLQAQRRTASDPAERARIAQRINELGDEWARSKVSASSTASAPAKPARRTTAERLASVRADLAQLRAERAPYVRIYVSDYRYTEAERMAAAKQLNKTAARFGRLDAQEYQLSQRLKQEEAAAAAKAAAKSAPGAKRESAAMRSMRSKMNAAQSLLSHASDQEERERWQLVYQHHHQELQRAEFDKYLKATAKATAKPRASRTSRAKKAG